MDEQKEETHNWYTKVRYTNAIDEQTDPKHGTDKKCPKCGLWSTGSALLCDCGYDFESGTGGRKEVNQGCWYWAYHWPEIVGKILFGDQ